MRQRHLLAGPLIALVLGCGGNDRPTVNLSARDFYRGQAPATQPAPAVAPAAGAADQAVAGNRQPEPRLSPATAESPVASGDGPATQPARGRSTGVFMIIGTIIAEVNGKALYADRILAKINNELYAQAMQKDPDVYRALAATSLQKQVQEAIHNELEFAAAQQTLSDEERQLAETLTMVWRQREITKAGGSLSVARDRSLNPPDQVAGSGMEFDERVLDQYRLYMVMIYYHKHVWPRIQISADDMRRYYDAHLQDIFSEKAAIRFRVIAIGARESGTAERAQSKIADVLQRARRGDDFGTLATMFNDKKLWAKNHGYMEIVDEEVKDEGDSDPASDDPAALDARKPEKRTRKAPLWYNKGTLALESLESALFKIEKNGITDAIDGKDGYLYIAKLEDKREGQVRPFEDQKVQADIRRRMENEQRLQLRRKEQQKLMAKAVWRIHEKNVDTAIEMAMQKYAMWRGGL